MKCPRCDYMRKPEDRECPKCGIDYAYVEKKMARNGDEANSLPNNPGTEAESVVTAEEEPMPETSPSPPDPVASPTPPSHPNECPKCGFANPKAADESLRSGTIFST